MLRGKSCSAYPLQNAVVCQESHRLGIGRPGRNIEKLGGIDAGQIRAYRVFALGKGDCHCVLFAGSLKFIPCNTAHGQAVYHDLFHVIAAEGGDQNHLALLLYGNRAAVIGGDLRAKDLIGNNGTIVGIVLLGAGEDLPGLHSYRSSLSV